MSHTQLIISTRLKHKVDKYVRYVNITNVRCAVSLHLPKQLVKIPSIFTAQVTARATKKSCLPSETIHKTPLIIFFLWIQLACFKVNRYFRFGTQGVSHIKSIKYFLLDIAKRGQVHKDFFKEFCEPILSKEREKLIASTLNRSKWHWQNPPVKTFSSLASAFKRPNTIFWKISWHP